MSKDNTAIAERRATLNAAANEIDRVASEAMTMFEQAGSFAQEIAVAQAVVDMRRMLTDDMMKPVLALMNTDLGFRTDRDPNQIDSKTGKPFVPYTADQVREVFIESKLRGFHTCGNEFNVIAGRFYGTQNGFKRKVRELTKGTFEASIDTPIISPDGKSAKIKCRATWRLNGEGERHDIGVRPEDPCEFLVRVNSFMGADAINGKAERKLLKRVFERITGRTIPEAEVEDGSIPVNATVQPQSERSTFKAASAASAKESPAGAPTTQGTATNPTAGAAPASNSAADEAAEAKAGLAPEKKPEPAEKNAQASLCEVLSENKVSFDDFRSWCKTTGALPDADSIPSWLELPEEFCKTLGSDAGRITRIIRLYGKK